MYCVAFLMLTKREYVMEYDNVNTYQLIITEYIHASNATYNYAREIIRNGF